MLSIRRTETTIAVCSEYNTEWIAHARNLGGKWNKEAWVFSLDIENLVKEKLREVFGTDGETATETVTVNVSMDHLGDYPRRELVLFGRTLASRRYRDTPVKLGTDTILLAGGFDTSGGSRNNPRLDEEPGTILQVRNVPVILIEKARVDYPEAFEVVSDVDKGSLEAEKEKLLARIEEIEALLNQ